MPPDPPPAASPAPSPGSPPTPAPTLAPGPAADPWARLRAATPARIGLAHSGGALGLGPVLELQLAHALARDAVHAVLDAGALAAAAAPHPVLRARSRAPDRATFLRRPDLGRRLDPACLEDGHPDALPAGRWDLAFVLADGLSATAVQRHAAPVLHACLRRLPGWSVAPAVIATQARVALGDEIGARLGARLVAVLIGERPGLSVPDSLGLYLTHDPRPGRRDSERNCISNIHGAGGLSPEAAAAKLVWLLRGALALGATGTGLKDDSDPAALAAMAALPPPGPR